MVLLSLSIPKFNQWFGPILLRYSVRSRFLLSRGLIRDNPYLDAFCGIPLALKLIQLEVYHECKSLETNIKSASESETLPLSFSKGTQKLQSSNHINDELTKRRLQVFEKYIRPALLPNNTWLDIRIWQFHYRILKWLRTEYLIVKYRSTIRHILFQTDPQKSAVRKSPQLTKDFFGAPRRNQNDPWTSIRSLLRIRNTSEQLKPDDVTDSIKLLPHSATLTKVFDMMDWEMHQKNLKASRRNMEQIVKRIGGEIMEIRGASIGIAHVEGRDFTTLDVTNLSLEEIIEVTGGHVMQCNAFNALCEDADIYQFWTREYIELLGRYLLQRSTLLQQQHQQSRPDGTLKETIILDVGAGDGLLAQLLREFMNTEWNNIHTATTIAQKKSKSSVSSSSKPSLQHPSKDDAFATRTKTSVPTIIASDSGAWGISPIAPVTKQTVQEAVEMYLSAATPHPQYHIIVLCSWMPMNTDWTAIFRQDEGVDEYVLIGECDDGQCGDNWLTWGNLHHLHDDALGTMESDAKVTPQYVLDGYVRHDLNEFSPHQFSRFDCRTSKTGRTVSFRKQKKNVSSVLPQK